MQRQSKKLHIMETVKNVKKVDFHLPSDAVLVADFNYVSMARLIEHCWLFISLPSDSVMLAYTCNSQSAIGVMHLGFVSDFESRLKMLKEAIFAAYRLSNN